MFLPRRQPAGPPWATILIIAGVVAVVGAGLWFWLRPGSGPGGDWSPSQWEAGDTITAEDPFPGAFDDVEPLADLPELDASDELIRSMVATISAHPRLAAWLVTDDLARRFVRAIADLAGGFHPAEHVPFLRPDEPFSVRSEGGRTVIAPASYARYDLLTAVFVSLDTNGTVRLFHQLRPLVDEAWEELGAPGDFDDALLLAIANLRAVDIPDGPFAVVPDEAVYAFQDAELEARRGAAKALLRTGPENATRIQRKLAEFEEVLTR